jgi:hypothetical protein
MNGTIKSKVRLGVLALGLCALASVFHEGCQIVN